MLIYYKDLEKTLKSLNVKRKIKVIQNHHTYKPSYQDFTGNNHTKIVSAMKYYHTKINGWDDIAQHITTFPDGTIAIGGTHGRSFDKDPAGIKGANAGAICIEHIGNFDAGNDTMSDEHIKAILTINKVLSNFFILPLDTDHFIYHHWYDLKTGKRTDGKSGTLKSCPGSNWFTGNSIEDAKTFLILVGGVLV